MQVFFCSAFGLNVRVECREPIPSLRSSGPSERDTSNSDLIVHLMGNWGMDRQRTTFTKRLNEAKILRFRHEKDSIGSSRWFSCDGHQGGIEFVLSDDCRQMWVRWSGRVSQESVLSLLFNTMLALVVRLSGRICLHASVVARNGRAIAFVAPSGFGKSTLAASLLEHGYAGMTDDAAALTQHQHGFLVHPGLPQLGLREPSLEILTRFAAEASVVANNKRRFPLVVSDGEDRLRFQDREMPLAGIFFLRRSAVADKPEVLPSTLVESLAILMNSLYPTSRLSPKRHRVAKQFSSLSQLVEKVPCRHLILPDALSKLPSVSDRLAADLALLHLA